jgi:hypothetical protein
MSRVSFALTIAVLFVAVVALSIFALHELFVSGPGNEGSAETTQGRTQATQTTEETAAYGEETTALDETTALEETTAVQAPQGTPTSSTARIVCLRADQGASPPPNSTEVLNDDVLTRVLTPKVAAHPDGVHYRIDNHLGKKTTYTSDPGRENFVVLDLPKGISKHVEEFRPGLAEFQCDPTGEFNPHETARAHFEVVVGDSGYKSLELECKPGATPSFSAAADLGGYAGSHPVAHAREQFSERLKEGDVVEEAAYPEEPQPRPVRVVRNGDVVATIEYEASGYYETYCQGQF